MSRLCKLMCTCVVLVGWALPSLAATRYLITNDDNPAGNTASFYSIGEEGRLTLVKTVSTGGLGQQLGFESPVMRHVGGFENTTQACVYVANAGSADVAAIDETTLKLVGTFKASKQDVSEVGGIALAGNENYLYAAFGGPRTDFGLGTIATYKVLPVCKLQFIKSIIAKGLITGVIGVGGMPTGMALHNNGLVVAYGDGSINSFDISRGIPRGNRDITNSTGFIRANNNLMPASVQITKDGHWAIFGDNSLGSGKLTVEVADLSTGRIKAPTKEYAVDNGVNDLNAFNLALNPGESLLYVSNSNAGNVVAAFFDKTTGTLTPGCTSPTLAGFQSTWRWLAGIAVADTTTGDGKEIYAAEEAFGLAPGSAIGIVEVQSDGKTCSLTESKNSPVTDNQAPALTSLFSWPPPAF